MRTETSTRATLAIGGTAADPPLDVSDEIIADVTVGTMAENETSLGYQERFAAAVPR